METQQLDDFADDGAVVDHRAQARAMLDQIARQVKAALTKQGIDLDLFFLIPSVGDAIMTFGTVADPPDDEWAIVEDIVTKIVAQAVGLQRTRTRAVVCTSTDAAAASPVAMPVPISAPLPVMDAGTGQP